MPSDFTAVPDGAAVVVTGEIDMVTAPALRDALALAATSDGQLTVDLSAARYLDSAGVAVLFDYVRAGLEVVVRAGSPVARVIGIAGLRDVAIVRSVHPESQNS